MDKLEKVVNELEITKKKPKKEVTEANKVEITSEQEMVEQPLENIVSDYYQDMEIVQIALKDSYLPSALVKAGLFRSNAEARLHLRNAGIVLNGSLTKNSDATNFSENFEVEFERKKYQFFVI